MFVGYVGCLVLWFWIVVWIVDVEYDGCVDWYFVCYYVFVYYLVVWWVVCVCVVCGDFVVDFVGCVCVNFVGEVVELGVWGIGVV